MNSSSRMSLGDEEIKFVDAFMPVTPEKPILASSNSMVDRHGSQLGRENWQQLSGFKHLQQISNYNRMAQHFGQTDQMGRIGSSVRKNRMINQIAGSFTQTQALLNETAVWNTVPHTILNTSLSMAERPLFPNFHYPESGAAEFLSANQTHCSNSIVLSHDGFPICNSLNVETYGTSTVTNSFQFAPVTPQLTKKLVQEKSCYNVVSIENFQDEHNSGQVLHSIVDSSSAVISSPVEEPKVATISTLIEEPKDSRLVIDLNKTPKQKTPKRRKHRPKVIVEGKPNRTPKAATTKITDPKQKATEKRKYVRKKSQQESATQQPDSIGEITDSAEKPKERRKYVRKKDLKEPATESADHIGETAYATAGPAAPSCKRALKFDLENVSGEKESNLVAQQELLNKKTETSKRSTGFQIAESIKITNMICRTEPSLQMSQQNDIMLEKSESISNFIPSMNLMLDNNVSILGRTEAGTSYTSVCDRREAAIQLASRKDVQMAHLNASARDTDIRKQQQIPAEGIGQIFIPMWNENCKTIERTGHMMCHTNTQSVTEGSPYLTESRRPKREYCHVEQTNHCTTNPLRQEILHTDDYHPNSLISKAVCSEACKKKKTGNGIQTNIYGMLASVGAVNHSRGKASSNYVNSIASAPQRNSEILNSYLESNNIRREDNGSNRSFDGYTHSVASGQDMPKQSMLSGPCLCTERTGGTITSAMVQKLASTNTFETCNMLPPTPPKTSSQPRDQLQPTPCNINVSMKEAMTPIQYQSVSSTKGKMLQPKISILKDQHSPGKRRGRLAEQKFPITIEDIIYQMECFNLNETKGEEQNALVPYKGDGTLIPLERFEVIKKHKPRPKVDLDPETTRVWKMLMWKEGSEGFEGTDQEKMQWWEEERRVFCGRADSFIARMHLVQGDRRFSKWKGSVVDSVIGVFLTQNVSDHLSSSAFMSLVARFPLKSSIDRTCERDGPIILVEEPYLCMPNLSGMDKLQKLWGRPFYSHSSMTPHKSAEYWRDSETSCKERTSIVQAQSHSPEEEVLSSEDSFDSSVIQSNGVVSYLEAEAPVNGCKCNKNHSTCSHLPQAESTTSFKEFFSHVMFPEGSRHGHKQPADIEYQQQLPRLERLYDSLNGSSAFNRLIYYNNPLMQKPTIPSCNYQYTTAQSGSGVESSVLHREESTSSWPTSTSRSSKEKDTSHTSKRIVQEAESVARTMKPQYRSAWYQETPTVESQSIAKPADLADAQTKRQLVSNTPRLTGEVFDVEARISLVESNSNDQVNFTNKANLNANTIKARKERGKPNDKKKNAVDWDSLRKQVLANGRRKGKSKDEMDSLDYEAMRCASINEISDAIKERGMNNILAERIKEFLNRLVRDHESIDLEWLRDVPPDIAKDYLLSIQGLGLKSVECVRLLTLHHLAFPVDTNVGRIAVRLGWVPLQPLPESLQLHLLELYPVLESIQKYLWPRLCKLDQRTLYELHYQMITFGKVFCTKNRPNCNACPMRAECRHFASAFASARLALPGPEEKSIVTQTVPLTSERSPGIVIDPMPLPPPEDNSTKRARSDIVGCIPIIEEPASPEQHIEVIRSDIEDVFDNDPDEIPTIKFNMEELSVNLQNYMQAYMELQECDMSKALVALNPEAASIPTPKLKNVSRLRTEHQVYELPDSHPLLRGMDKREPDDPSPYLLAIWTPGETADSIEQPGHCQSLGEPDKLCNQKTCFSCNSIREANSQIVRGTLLIPCKTAMRGSFPLNGTYFQVNEMFADHASSINPIDVPRAWIWNLPRRMVYFGTSVPTIFKGLSTERIQYCFWKGFVCVRGFDQKTRAPRPLMARLHFPASKLAKTKNEKP